MMPWTGVMASPPLFRVSEKRHVSSDILRVSPCNHFNFLLHRQGGGVVRYEYGLMYRRPQEN